MYACDWAAGCVMASLIRRCNYVRSFSLMPKAFSRGFSLVATLFSHSAALPSQNKRSVIFVTHIVATPALLAYESREYERIQFCCCS
jgi:hypothetical protein